METAIQEYNEPKKAVRMYENASLLVITEEEQKKLQLPVDPEEVEVRPDGLIYYPQVFVRDQLNSAFGIGQWALIQNDVKKDPDFSKLYFDGSLFVRGHFLARAVGEQEYHDSNPMQSWGSAYEGAKSDCLVRCCKDLGIGKELWQPKYTRDWLKEHAVKVFVKVTNRKTNKEETKVQWRRKDQDPFWNETGIVNDNQGKRPESQYTSQQKIDKNGAYYEKLFKNCKTTKEVNEVYNKLPKEEKGKGTLAQKEAAAKQTSIVNEENKKDSIIPLINNIKKYDESLFADIEEKIEQIQDQKRRVSYIDIFRSKITNLNIDYTITVLPF